MSSQALQLLTPGLTELQAAAVKRIEAFQKELAGYGMYVRTGVELKFTTQDADGNPAPKSINIKNAESYLKRASTYIEGFGHSDITEWGQIMTPSKYQVKFLDMGDKSPHRKLIPETLSPVATAREVALVKNTTLPNILRLKQTTCLTPSVSEYSGLQSASIIPSFLARPHPECNGLEASLTSGMHINMSLYNNKGDNLFAANTILAQHCANGIADMQRMAGLGFLPTENSLLRVGANNCVSKYIYAGKGRHKDNEHSVNIRTSRLHPDEARLENRMPGADTDPYVSIALTLAGIVRGVRKNIFLEKPQHIANPSVLLVDEAHAPYIAPEAQHIAPTPIPTDRTRLADTLQRSSEMRELLGEEFLGAIMHAYAPQREAVR